MCTHENPVLKAILARAPTLDVFEAALVGDAKRVAVLVTSVGLLFWEMRYVGATLAFPGIKPPQTGA